MRKRFAWLACLCLALLVVSIPTRAQSGDSAWITLVQTDAFPLVQVYMDVHSDSGGFVHGLQVADLRLMEDGQPLQVNELEQLLPGVQAVIAINPGESMTIRNSQGISRYDLIRQALLTWLETRRGSSVDDLSLSISDGPERTHNSDPAELIDGLGVYNLPTDAPVPTLETLNRALDLAADSSPRQGMERAVLFITSPLSGDPTEGIETLATRANELGVRVYVWLVAAPDLAGSPSSNLLAELAERTGGAFLEYSGAEPLPDLETYWRDLRDIYRLSYDSRLSSGGVHQLAVEIHQDGQVIQLPVKEYTLDLSPPDPIFIMPPAEIQRGFLPGEQGAAWEEIDLSRLSPREQRLQLLIDFLDGRPRSLRRTALYVDGAMVAENTQPPFDTFTWDISPYTASGEHILYVEAEDELGLTGRSIDTLVTVVVNIPPVNPFAQVLRRWPTLAGLAVLLIGSFTLLGLILAGRIHPRVFGWQPGRRGPRKAGNETGMAEGRASAERSPAAPAGRNLSGWINRFHWPARRLAIRADAFLTPVAQADQPASAAPISLSAGEITLGSDPSQATLLVNDPSVDALHARLARLEDGPFKLSDAGSVAGTWVNYGLLSQEGVVLKHGDLIHLGRVCFRFTQREISSARKPVITPLEAEH